MTQTNKHNDLKQRLKEKKQKATKKSDKNIWKDRKKNQKQIK